MGQILINSYLREIDRLKKFSGTTTEQVIREAFKDLLKNWAKSLDLIFVPELEHQTSLKTKVYPDGTIVHDLRVPLGYWEAKDTADDLDVEITKKFTKGYPQDNIVFENSETAILWQNRKEVLRCDMTDVEALEKLVTLFFSYERQEIAQFRRAVEQFKTDLPHVLDALREKIDDAYRDNKPFADSARKFLEHARGTINPSLNEADIREMLIQHILTEEIFAHVFNESDFHRENNIAKELYALEGAFFTGGVKKNTLKALEPYYAAIRANAAQITSHTQKQTFLKVIYENFYKVYNPKAADRLGVVYTPNEIVRFMIEGADWLCQKHFDKTLIDKGVEILDPATGTGTYICEMIEYFRGQPEKLKHKFEEELHANEVAILPYYVANLNIEATYAAVTGEYAEFPNLCFVDTLDNTGGLGMKAGYTEDLFAAVSDENVARVKRQNERKISVVIGNPPYNANQQNENDNNKNREYKKIDALIKNSFVKLSTAQKTKVYDMYARFFRWSSDRLSEDGIIAFITNRSFVDSRTFDGFRRFVGEEFNEAYIVDLGGDVRANAKLSGTKNNVFGIQTGVAISYLVKNPKRTGCKIYYSRRPEMDTAEEKLAYLSATTFAAVEFEEIKPDHNATWINQSENNWDNFPAVADKLTKTTAIAGQERAIFKMDSFGVVTARDEWVYSLSKTNLRTKVGFLIDAYNADLKRSQISTLSGDADEELNSSIKWSRAAKNDLKAGTKYFRNTGVLVDSSYRPFYKSPLHFNGRLIEVQYQQTKLFGEGGELPNQVIVFTGPGSQKAFMASAVNHVFDYHYVGAAAAAAGLPLYRYSEDGERFDNVTDWGLEQFLNFYGKEAGIKKADIFRYVYGVLHDPVYLETYSQNLKRDFPRIPFYPNFHQWADWGERLMSLHIGYEAVDPWPLKRKNTTDEKSRNAGVPLKVMLKADKEKGTIIVDSETVLSGIPAAAWSYQLGNKSGLEWILDQYKEKTPKDVTIREKFNTYKFADHKTRVVDLIRRVTRVSVETMEIVEAMKNAKRD